MEIFKKGIKFNNLAEVYVGLKLKHITINKLIDLIENNQVKHFEAEDYTALIINKDSEIKFSNELQKISSKKSLISSDGTRIWYLEFILRKINKYNTTSMLDFKTKILEGVYELFYFFDYPSEWSLSKFILYSVDNDGKSLNQDELYNNLLTFIDKEIDFFIRRV